MCAIKIQAAKDYPEKYENNVLLRLLATPPQPKTKALDEANPPKKRGRPKQEKGSA
jgi:hypothetical protein